MQLLYSFKIKYALQDENVYLLIYIYENENYENEIFLGLGGFQFCF